MGFLGGLFEKKNGSITFSVCLMATGYVRHP